MNPLEFNEDNWSKYLDYLVLAIKNGLKPVDFKNYSDAAMAGVRVINNIRRYQETGILLVEGETT